MNAAESTAPHKVKSRLSLSGGLVDFVKHQHQERDSYGIVDFSGKGHRARWRSRCNGTPVFRSVHTIIAPSTPGAAQRASAALTSVVARTPGPQATEGQDPNLTGDDIREGLAAVISVKVSEPQFEGRPRPSQATKVKSFMQVCNKQLTHWFEMAPPTRKSL